MLLFFDKVVKYNKIRKIPPEYKTTIVKINQFFKKNMLTIIDTKIKIINNNRALNIGSKKIIKKYSWVNSVVLLIKARPRC